jgi:hypothetical protein
MKNAVSRKIEYACSTIEKKYKGIDINGENGIDQIISTNQQVLEEKAIEDILQSGHVLVGTILALWNIKYNIISPDMNFNDIDEFNDPNSNDDSPIDSSISDDFKQDRNNPLMPLSFDSRQLSISKSIPKLLFLEVEDSIFNQSINSKNMSYLQNVAIFVESIRRTCRAHFRNLILYNAKPDEVAMKMAMRITSTGSADDTTYVTILQSILGKMLSTPSFSVSDPSEADDR